MGYPYGQPQRGYYGYPPVPEIPNHKGWAVFTLFCGFVFGVAALAKANEVDMARQRGDLPRAWQASNTAKALCVIGNIVGVVVYAALIVWIVVLAS
ncbi:CD225/dispanin family protein [Amycolatopsis sp.]|uniref:CD225/dispanin family protein n=1 Tax=Amycolatopsis sp. TaxID=37632 RepID=UPI002C3B7131|nr:CD225/dispanin family protein [Amycolatopsis sp.]HVV09387.1 CD225/dispanin family protein [Amycolatopsis sp.]